MSVLRLNHIKKKVLDDFAGLVDISDWPEEPPDQEESLRLTPGLAAFTPSELLALDSKVAASCVTDGGDDNGIDAIGIDPDGARIVVVQTKWDTKGTGSPALGDVQKFAQGFRDLINALFERFNPKIQARKAEINAALDNPDVQFLFNPGVTATRMWRSVEVLRAVDKVLRVEQAKLEGRERSVAVHGNRLIAVDDERRSEPLKRDR